MEQIRESVILTGSTAQFEQARTSSKLQAPANNESYHSGMDWIVLVFPCDIFDLVDQHTLAIEGVRHFEQARTRGVK